MLRLVDRPYDQLVVSINDAATVSPISAHRSRIARRSLPTFVWSMDEKGTWRLEHIPLDTYAPPAAFQAWRDSLAPVCTDTVLINRMLRRVNHLETAVVGHTSPASLDWREITQGLASVIVQEVCGTAVKAVNYTELFRELQLSGAVQGFLRELVRVSAESGAPVGFSQGGYLQVKVDDSPIRFKAVRADTESGLRLELWSSATGWSSFEINSLALDRELRVGGPLENLLLATNYDLVDMPSFAAADYLTASRHREYISPIVCVDRTRSGGFGGGGLRLAPGGYTLFDYASSPEAMAFISSLLGGERPTRSEVQSWSRQLGRVPAAKAKASKSQSVASTWRHEIECESAAPVRLDGRLQAFGSATSKSALATCDQFADLLGALNLLRGAHRTEGQRKVRTHLGWHHFIEYSGSSPLAVKLGLFDLVANLGEQGCDFLSSWGMPSSRVAAHVDVIGALLAEQRSLGTWTLDTPRSGIGVLHNALRALFDDYLAFLLFFSTTVVKAHAPLLYLLLGPKGTAAALREMLNERGPRRTLPFTPDVYSTLSGAQEGS